jgi:hypothetical protein
MIMLNSKYSPHVLLVCLIFFPRILFSQNNRQNTQIGYHADFKNYYADTTSSGIKSVYVLHTMKSGKQMQDTLVIKIYDKLGRISKKIDPSRDYGNFYYEYWYSSDEKQFATSSMSGNQQRIVFHQKDDAGRVIQSAVYRGYRIQDTLKINLIESTNFSYNKMGKLQLESSPNKYIKEYSYDAKGLLTQIEYKNLKWPGTTFLTEFQYDASNLLIQENNSQKNEGSKIEIGKKVYKYDAGNCIYWEEILNPQLIDNISYELVYDSTNSLTKLCKHFGEKSGCASYYYHNNQIQKVEAKMTDSFFCGDLGFPPMQIGGNFECTRINYYDLKGNLEKVECYVGPSLSDVIVYNLELY